MAEIIIICLAAFLTSILTFFSGFGLGTILMPVFALFFPVDVAEKSNTSVCKGFCGCIACNYCFGTGNRADLIKVIFSIPVFKYLLEYWNIFICLQHKTNSDERPRI